MLFMKTFSTLTILALVAAATVAGCTAPSAQENAPPADKSDAPAQTTTDTTADAAPATPAPPVEAATQKPVAKTYRVTKAGDQSFGPDAPKEMVDTYIKAMNKVALPPPAADMKVPDKVRVQMQTNRGPITLELDAKAAPLQVKSFVYLADKGFYNGTNFHRHADLLGGGKGFIIQGGDPLTKDANAVQFAGMGGPGYEVPREKNKLTHQKLVIAAARTSDPDSAGSQFYITQDAVPFLDEGDGYTVFGKVVDGEDAALKLQKGDTLQSVKVEDSKK